MQRNPSQLADRKYDVVVIGGGIYGACIAWDATLRGLSVALVERGDFGQETSANSLKTVHGGLRYLQDFDLNLVRMMIEERSTYLRIAPHLVQPLACITPTYSKLTKSRLVLGTAMKVNDIAGYDRNKSLDREIPSSQLLSMQACQDILPDLPNEGVTGAALWHDAQIYDTERLTLAFIASAANAGADVSNYVEATGFLTRGNQIEGITSLDKISNETFEIQSQIVVNSAGPWIDSVLGNLEPNSRQPVFQHSLAINIITREIVRQYAAGVPSWPGGINSVDSQQPVSHMLFISPWRGNSIIGTFHSHYHGEPDQFSLEEKDMENIILEANSAYPGANLELNDIKFAHYGFLPELPNSKQPEVKLVRKSRIVDHQKEDGLSGLISVMGVKYTTARKSAEKVVDLVYEKLNKDAVLSNSHTTQVHGGQIDSFENFLSSKNQEDSSRLTRETIDHWVRSYGTEYSNLLELLDDHEDQFPQSLFSESVIRAQVGYAIREEMAVKLADVIFRRTGIGTVGQLDNSILEIIAETMASKLGWSKDKVNLEIEEVRANYRRHTASDPAVEYLEKT